MAADFDIDFVAFQVLTAAQMDTMGDNDRALHDGTALPSADADTNSVTGSDTINSATYAAAPTNPGPAVTVPIGDTGKAWIEFGGKLKGDQLDTELRMAVAISGASTVAAADLDSLEKRTATVSDFLHMSYGYLKEGLTPGNNTFTCQYRINNNTGTVSNRRLSVIPL